MLDKGLLTLVGAGPGDPELITLKGLKAIDAADVILYDALANKELLSSNKKALTYYVGKRKGKHSHSQTEINHLIVSNARKGKHVVRLKGGDVSVFARAAEELEYAALFGIETKVIPGISSYSGIAAQHQIPLTRRCENESIWITTGYTCEGEISNDIQYAAQSSATVVIFMGMSKLASIQKEFLQYKPFEYPVAVVQNGTLPNEKQLVTNLGKLTEDVKKNNLENPAILIVGHAVTSTVSKLLSTINESEITA